MTKGMGEKGGEGRLGVELKGVWHLNKGSRGIYIYRNTGSLRVCMVRDGKGTHTKTEQRGIGHNSSRGGRKGGE